MAYKYSKKTPRKGKGGYPRRATKSTSTEYNGSTLEKYVEAKFKRAISKATRGPPQSVYVRLLPCSVDRTLATPEFKSLKNDEWPAYLKGPLAERKYALLPITELIPSQRAPASIADDEQRPHDTVFIKGVSIRMTICHARSVRLMLFAFRNGNRQDVWPAPVTRPFQVVEDGSEVARQVSYELMTDRLLGVVDASEKQNSARHLEYHDGPFAVCRKSQGEPVWKSVDESASTSRLSKEEGRRPTGNVQFRLGQGITKQCGLVCNMNLSSSSMRTFTTLSEAGVDSSRAGMRFRELEFFVTLNRRERFQAASGSRSVSERPLELFLGFDGAKPSEIHITHASSRCGAITAMDMEVYYEWVDSSSPVAPVLGPTRRPA
ncbi:hypothetical protein N7463_003002 [Penicillium fimorum]|uniref:Uncharacterized protein n=1 Tax=Penicillium fimorum TaxID=1882269 RepID=A0A9W9Y1K0_9EURO|nr:hypothetical protein N7463_003002 [Penicillium fimorum]